MDAKGLKHWLAFIYKTILPTYFPPPLFTESVSLGNFKSLCRSGGESIWLRCSLFLEPTAKYAGTSQISHTKQFQSTPKQAWSRRLHMLMWILILLCELALIYAIFVVLLFSCCVFKWVLCCLFKCSAWFIYDFSVKTSNFHLPDNNQQHFLRIFTKSGLFFFSLLLLPLVE